jgi:hypothetical protein
MEESTEEDKKKGARDSLLKWLETYLAEYKVNLSGFPKCLQVWFRVILALIG